MPARLTTSPFGRCKYLPCVQRMELVNQGSGPTVGVIEIWTRPSPVKSTASMTLLGSLSGSSGGGSNISGARSRSGSSPPKTTTSPTLDVTLFKPLKISGALEDRERDYQAGGKAVQPGARVELALRQRAGEADSDHDALAEVAYVDRRKDAPDFGRKELRRVSGGGKEHLHGSLSLLDLSLV